MNATIGHDAEIALLALGAVLVYAWHVRRHPWMPCRRCGGGGKARHLSLSPFGTCRRCGGSGKRLRAIAWLLRWNVETGRKR